MASYKVGDRVKRVRDPFPDSASNTEMPLGMTGTVMAISSNPLGTHVFVKPDGPTVFGERGWGCEAYTLEPLTPPAVDRFIEKVKSWKPLDEPIRESIVVTGKATYSVKGESAVRISK